MHVRDDPGGVAPPSLGPRRAHAGLSADLTPFGVYVHIPFCGRRCDYCAFATWTDRGHLMEPYVAACRRQVAQAVMEGMPPATSVFFGGGTPSLLPVELLAGLLAAIPRHEDAEVTVECNPDTVTPSSLAGYRAAGVTRLSFGVQSMVVHVLAALGRSHEPAGVAQAVGWARSAGLANFNLDLIYGAAGESDDDWLRTLDAALALDPPHVSAYALTVEPGTPLAADPGRHPDEDLQATRYLVAERVLTEAGLSNYEISNWARPGAECRHNLLYWSEGEYLGVGCAAHSHVAGRRWWNVRTPDRYIALESAGESVVAGTEELDDRGRALEAAQLALRTSAGIACTTVAEHAAAELDELCALGLVEVRGDRVVLTARGRLLANEVVVRLGLAGELVRH